MNELNDKESLMILGEKIIELGNLCIELAKATEEDKVLYLSGKMLMLASELQGMANEE